ncbi:MAG: transporter [Rhodospirillales bacterium]|nr:transporter [Rhodospirillales bacterium]
MAVIMASSVTDDPTQPAADEGHMPLLMLAVLMSGGVLATMTFTTVTPSLTFIAAYFGAQGQGILGSQLVLTMAPLGMSVGGPLAGWIGSRFGLKQQLFAALILYGLAGLAILVAEGIGAFLLARFVLGFASVNIDTAMTSILGARFSGARRARLMGIRSGISSTGTFGTILISGMIAQAGGWRAPFWMYMTVFVVLAVALIAFRQPLGKPPPQPAGAKFSVLSLWPIYGLTLLMAIAHTMPSFQMGFLLKEDGLTSPVNLSRVLALGLVISVMGSFAFGWFYVRLQRWTIVLAMALLAAGYGVVGLFHSVPVEIAGIVISGFGAGFTIPYMVTRTLDQVTQEKRPQAVGFLLSAMFMGHFFNPLFVAPIRNNFGNHAIFLITGLLLGAGGIAIALSILASRRLRPLAVEIAE